MKGLEKCHGPLTSKPKKYTGAICWLDFENARLTDYSLTITCSSPVRINQHKSAALGINQIKLYIIPTN